MTKESKRDILEEEGNIGVLGGVKAARQEATSGERITEAVEQECRHPIDVGPFFEKARLFVSEIRDVVPLTSAILDDWNTGEGIEGARIIYGAPCVTECKSQCSGCPLFKTVGEDNPLIKTDFRTSLCQATEGQLDLFPSKQKYLNCKTPEQYQEAFIVWIVEKCDSSELIKAELDWVKGFRILLLDGEDDIGFLKEKEKEYKTYIIEEVLGRLGDQMDLQRAEIVSGYGHQIGLI